MTINAITTNPQAAPAAVDPWAFQQKLMAASSQLLPEAPQLNKGVVLYGALTLEEVSEMISGLADALAANAEKPGLVSLSAHFRKNADDMLASSKQIRKELESITDFSVDIAESHLDEMIDGTTDTTVVNCGFALSLGINGAAFYEEVGRSNLSKRNPDTGKIDKTPDGKWIKGRDFFKPDLKKVLAETTAARITAATA